MHQESAMFYHLIELYLKIETVFAVNCYAGYAGLCSAMFCHLIESAAASTLLRPLSWATSLVILLLLAHEDDDEI